MKSCATLTDFLTDLDHQETQALSEVGAILVVYGSQRRLTLNAHLSQEDKDRALAYMRDRLGELVEGQPALHVWLPDGADC